jgi:hypothetical protein
MQKKKKLENQGLTLELHLSDLSQSKKFEFEFEWKLVQFMRLKYLRANSKYWILKFVFVLIVLVTNLFNNFEVSQKIYKM